MACTLLVPARALQVFFYWKDGFGALIGLSEASGGVVQGVVLVAVHVEYGYMVSGDESATVDYVSHFSW